VCVREGRCRFPGSFLAVEQRRDTTTCHGHPPLFGSGLLSSLSLVSCPTRLALLLSPMSKTPQAGRTVSLAASTSIDPINFADLPVDRAVSSSRGCLVAIPSIGRFLSVVRGDADWNGDVLLRVQRWARCHRASSTLPSAPPVMRLRSSSFIRKKMRSPQSPFIYLQVDLLN
jgi:hypothetical protein